MSNHIPQTQHTNLGTADSLQKDRENAKRNFNKIEKFNDDVQIALMMAQESGEKLPVIEASREVIEHFNRQNIKGFDSAGYFIHKGVLVCENGNSDAIKRKLEKSESLEPHDYMKASK